MFNFESLNKNNKKFDFDMTGKSFTYVKPSELNPDEVYTVRMFYVNKKGKYGDAPCAVLDGNIVNLPSHLLEDVKNIISNPEAVEAVNAGKCGIQSYSYEKDGKDYYSINFVTIK